MKNGRGFIYRKYEKPQAVEQLVLQVNPNRIEEFLKNDHELWTLGEAGRYTFAGKENWCSASDSGRLYITVYFGELAGWHSIPEVFLVETEEEMQRRMGEGNVQTIEYIHDRDMQYKVSEYMPEVINGEWEFSRYSSTCVVEEIVFMIEENALEKFLRTDQKVWQKVARDGEGFMGKETWISSKTGLVTSIVYWEGEPNFEQKQAQGNDFKIRLASYRQ